MFQSGGGSQLLPASTTSGRGGRLSSEGRISGAVTKVRLLKWGAKSLWGGGPLIRFAEFIFRLLLRSYLAWTISCDNPVDVSTQIQDPKKGEGVS